MSPGNNISRFLSVALLILTTTAAFAQNGVLSGAVTVSSGQPVESASVMLKPGNWATMTDEKGRYTFTDVPFGTYILMVTSLEIQPIETRVVLDRAHQRKNIVTEKNRTTRLDEANVSRNTEKREMETSGFAVAVIETKEASVRNLTTNELLDRTVGVRVRQNGGVGSRVEYNLNGLSGSAVGLFLDGIEISTYGSSFNLNNIPPAMIDRIEIYKGVLPSHLTGDYVGGAINVVLKKDASRNNITVATSYGSFNTFQADIGTTFRHKKSGFSTRASGFYTYTDNSFTTWGRSTTYVNHLQQITRPYRAKRFNDVYKSIGGRFEAGFTDVNWADQFFIGYNISDTYNEIPHGTTMAVPYVGRFSEFQAHVLSLNYNKKDLLVDGLALTVNAVRSNRSTYLQDTVGFAYNWDGTVREVIEFGERVPLRTTGGGQQGEKTITQIDRKITNVRSNLGYTIANRHRISFNHKFETTDRDDNDLLNPINKDLVTVSKVAKNILSANYEAQTFGDRLKTNLLAKYTVNKTSTSRPEIVTREGVNTIVRHDTTTLADNFGYGATLSYNILPSFYFIASGENAYVMPGEREMYGDPEVNILPNLRLRPEKNINYNLGLRWGAVDIGKHRISVYGSAFWRNGFDKITQQVVDEDEIEDESDADIQTTRYINLGKTQARGVEAEIIYIYDNRLNAMVNFSKFNNLFKGGVDAAGKNHDLYNEQVPNEPFFTINSNIQYRLNNIFQKQSVLNLYYNTGYVGEFYIVWGQPEWSKTPTQFTHDLGASYRFPNGKLIASVDAKNIFNAEAYDNFMVQKPGRGIYFKLNYTISKFL
ncbi:MAG TPA: TonB-dependent receptor plug domain-containing protein [Parapedobacter sp.]|uniref:TonB-dependent receptor n=1 Tax=Parapedobacter sp. TaxID=1958893 RepID=UPI002CEB1462|nr:TonB-dependent receptor plug domain-containing protein [Parapedobacter sp.]HWK57838.1 TonB-dependent receptor plug domain-containing protein [Parapedobacter sp.]